MSALRLFLARRAALRALVCMERARWALARFDFAGSQRCYRRAAWWGAVACVVGTRRGGGR